MHSEERIGFLRDNVRGRGFAELAEMFNQRFGTSYNRVAIKSLAASHGLRSGVRWNTKFSKEQLAFIKETFPGRRPTELTEMFNRRFGTGYTTGVVTSAAYRNGCKNGIRNKGENGVSTRFVKGQAAHNSGKKGWQPGGRSVETQFKPGCSLNRKPVGSERVGYDGYHWVKTADPRTWRMKHRLVWEAANGPVPDGHVIVFADGDRSNTGLGNLLLISRRELAVMNKKRLFAQDADLTRTGLNIVRVILKGNTRKRNKAAPSAPTGAGAGGVKGTEAANEHK